MTGWLIGGYVAGVIFEVTGVYLMANAYLARASGSAVLPVLLSALVRGKKANTAALPRSTTAVEKRVAAPSPAAAPAPSGTPRKPTEAEAREIELARKPNLKALQGLAFIGIGFVLQGVVTVVSLLG